MNMDKEMPECRYCRQYGNGCKEGEVDFIVAPPDIISTYACKIHSKITINVFLECIMMKYRDYFYNNVVRMITVVHLHEITHLENEEDECGDWDMIISQLIYKH